ncbi:hypothetical protein [Oceanobacillus limi]|nr:hypothetical protein [Oceanobacillus limi]
MISSVIPIIRIINDEQSKLNDTRLIVLELHDELQPLLWEQKTKLPYRTTKTINHKIFHLEFIQEESFIKGCGEWQNANLENEKICLYGYPKK